MYILVDNNNIIIGTAVRMIDEQSAADKGYSVYEISDSEFSPTLLGSKLNGFDKV